jgi:hypothetical protein
VSSCGSTSGRTAANLIDNDINTTWEHFVQENHWVILDLGQSTVVSKIRLWHRQYYATINVSEVYVSDNQADWGTSLGSLSIAASTEATGWKEADITDKQGRYIKLVSVNVNPVSWREFQIQTCHKSDTDCSGCVSSTELTAFIGQWYLDSSNPTLRELMEAIGLWKRGGC